MASNVSMNNYHVFQQVSKPPKVGLKKELHTHHSKGQWTRHWSEDKFPLTNGGSVNNENPEQTFPLGNQSQFYTLKVQTQTMIIHR